jgi:ParB family transcriptional regulator, chromosome partitioning protein
MALEARGSRVDAQRQHDVSKRDIHQHVLSKLRALPSADEVAPIAEIRRPSTYMGQVGVELKTGLKSRIEELEAQLASGEVVLQLDPKRIRATAFRNRDERSLSTDDESFANLKADIRAVGNRAPIEVRSLAGVPDFDYDIMSGHRRHAACLQLDAELAGGFRVRALIVDAAKDPVELVKGMHRENFLRKDPSPFEYGTLYAAAMKAGVFDTQADLAKAVGSNPTSVSHHIQLVELPAEVLAAFGDPRSIAVRWIKDLTRALKDRPEHVIATARDIVARETPIPPDQVKAELLKAPRKPRAGASLGSYEQTIRLGDKKTVGAKLKRDGRNLRLSIGATITSAALLRKMTDRVEAAVREVLREDEESRHA